MALYFREKKQDPVGQSSSAPPSLEGASLKCISVGDWADNEELGDVTAYMAVWCILSSLSSSPASDTNLYCVALNKFFFLSGLHISPPVKLR